MSEKTHEEWTDEVLEPIDKEVSNQHFGALVLSERLRLRFATEESPAERDALLVRLLDEVREQVGGESGSSMASYRVLLDVILKGSE